MKHKQHGHRLNTRGRAKGENDWEDYFERLEQREDDRRVHPARDGDDELEVRRRRSKGTGSMSWKWREEHGRKA